jgi:hypothetical protein
LRSNTKGYGGKTHYTDSQNSDTTAPHGRELYHLQFSLQAASPETFDYTIVQRQVEVSRVVTPRSFATSNFASGIQMLSNVF